MPYQDKTILCSDCGTNFTFSAAEQEQFAQRGYTNEPKRCPTCRQSRKSRQFGNESSSYRSDSYGSRPAREMFPVKCSECGKDTEVPFRPSGDRPVYCSDCFRKVRPPR